MAGRTTLSGRCIFIPSGIADPADPPTRARVPAYPVEEHFGLIFVFVGDLAEGERPVLRNILPEFRQPADWHVGILSREKSLNYVRMAENYNDPCHVHYVHEFGKWLPKGVTIETLELNHRYVRAFHAAWDAQGETSPDRGLLMEFDVVGMVSRNTNRQPGYPETVVVATVTPIDEEHTRILMLVLQPKAGVTAADHAALLKMTRDQVMDEDYAVLKTTRPRRAASPAEEVLVASDLTVAQVRKLIRDHAERHGEIDDSALAAIRETHVRVLPCAGHRTAPEQWVHKTVPLRASASGSSNRYGVTRV
ncbi:MAG: hypothetical protein R3F24_02920 [Gammaproteobacteria bacterium]